MDPSREFNVVLTDNVWPDLSIEYGIFSTRGIGFVATHCLSEEEVIRAAGQAEGIITIHAPITEKVIRSLKRCRVISVSGSGYNNVDVDAATRAGILLVNCPDYCVEEVADHTMALILSCARGVFLFDRRVRENIWDFKSAGDLVRIRDSVLGLIGFGRVSRAITERAKGFGLKVLAFDPFVPNHVFREAGVQRAGVHEILTVSDYVSIHTTLNPDTVDMISAHELSMMKSSAFLVNVSRGGIVNEAALYEALSQGIIRGAALDVLEREPPDFSHSLASLENVLITPHAAFYSEEAMEEVRVRSAQAIVKVYNRAWPDNIINESILQDPPLPFNSM